MRDKPEANRQRKLAVDTVNPIIEMLTRYVEKRPADYNDVIMSPIDSKHASVDAASTPEVVGLGLRRLKGNTYTPNWPQMSSSRKKKLVAIGNGSPLLRMNNKKK